MEKRRDNYRTQLQQAQKHFLTYDQEELIRRCAVAFDAQYLYTTLLQMPYRIHRGTGDMERLEAGQWVDGNGFGEVMTILDWLCDSRPDRYLTGRWINPVTQGYCFHRSLQEDGPDDTAQWIDRDPGAFCRACLALGGRPVGGADMGYAVELLDGLEILVQFWHSDEEFAPRLRFLWDENAMQYIRYETTWYAVGLLKGHIRRLMACLPEP